MNVDSATETETNSKPAKAKRFPIKRFAFVFLLLTFAGIGGVLIDVGDLSAVWEVLKRLSSSWLIIGMLVTFLLLDWYTDYLRYYAIAKHLGIQLNFRFGIKMVFANLFFAYLTPGGTFGAPVIIYMLYKRGEKVTHAIALALIKPFLLFFMLLASACFIFPFIEHPQVEALKIIPHIPLVSGLSQALHQETLSSWIWTRQLILFSSSVVFALTLFLASMVFYPTFAQRNIHRFFRYLRKRLQKKQSVQILETPRLDRWQKGLLSTAQAFALFGKAGWRGIFDGLLTTFLNLFFYLALSVTLLQGLGVNASLLKCWQYSYFYYFLIAFAPTPGGSGVAEGGGYLFFQSLASPEVVTSYVLMWRFLTCYLVMLLGAGLFAQFIRRMRMDELEELQNDSEKEMEKDFSKNQGKHIINIHPQTEATSRSSQG